MLNNLCRTACEEPGCDGLCIRIKGHPTRRPADDEAWPHSCAFHVKLDLPPLTRTITADQWKLIERRFAKLRVANTALGNRLAHLEVKLLEHERRGLQSSIDFIRASGSCVCTCMLEYRDHPEHPEWEFLHVLCDGSLVKL